MDIKAVERKRKLDDGTEIIIHQTQRPNGQAVLAGDFVARWGMVAARDDGEDSAGRQKVKTLSPAEVVSRACEMAALLWTEFELRGWLLEIPDPKDSGD